MQSITISTNPIKRLFGISFITFKQAVSGKINVKKNKLIRIVGCKRNQVETVKSSLFNTAQLENSEKKRTDNYYKKRLFFILSFFTITLYTVLVYVVDSLEVLYSVVVIAPLIIFLILKKVEKRYYKISESMLLVGSGLLETHLTYLEIFKVQNIKMKQNIFQERSNVADLILQTASGKIKIPCIHFNDAIQIYNHTLFKVETSKSLWM